MGANPYDLAIRHNAEMRSRPQPCRLCRCKDERIAQLESRVAELESECRESAEEVGRLFKELFEERKRVAELTKALENLLEASDKSFIDSSELDEALRKGWDALAGIAAPTHKWSGCRRGGNPSESGSYEYVRFCEVCGIEDTCEDPLPPCIAAPNKEGEGR